MKKHKRGFTLAEVLITLVIIGIIAAMTIPTLMNKTNEQETVVAVKKAYSVLGQAWQRMIAENGDVTPSALGTTKEETTKSFGDMIVPCFNIQKNCGTSTDEDCWSTKNGGMYKHFDDSDWKNYNSDGSIYKFRTPDGVFVALGLSDSEHLGRSVSISGEGPLSYVFGYADVDINGDKGPNTAGKDVFQFAITKDGFVPRGLPDDSERSLAECRTHGAGCTAWVVTKGNMDYLRKDVSW